MQDRDQARGMAASKSTQGELTEGALLDWPGTPRLVDIGLNLADSSFDKVKRPQRLPA